MAEKTSKGQQPAWRQYLYIQQQSQDVTSTKTVDEQLAEDSVFFKYMLDLVPANFYFSQHTRDQLKEAEGEEDQTSDSSDEEEQAMKESKSGRKKKHARDTCIPDSPPRLQKKKAKYDPMNARTVTQLQQELLDRNKKKAALKAVQKQVKSSTQKSELSAVLSGVPRSTEPEDLRQKLKAKLHELQAKRKATEYIDRIERKKQKRRESKKRLKQKKQAEKKDNKKTGEKLKLINGLLSPKSKLVSPGKPIFNKEGKMVFSKFDFMDSREVGKKSDLPTGSNYKQLLQKVERQKQKMQEIQHTDVLKARKLKQKETWKTALQKAEGVKVKDNPEMLKKALKKKEKKKEKRKKDWQDRTEKVEKQMQKQQEKRKRNIQKKKQSKIDKKIKKAKKKGRIIPGF